MTGDRQDWTPEGLHSRPGFAGPSLLSTVVPSLYFCAVYRPREFYEEMGKL